MARGINDVGTLLTMGDLQAVHERLMHIRVELGRIRDALQAHLERQVAERRADLKQQTLTRMQEAEMEFDLMRLIVKALKALSEYNLIN